MQLAEVAYLDGERASGPDSAAPAGGRPPSLGMRGAVYCDHLSSQAQVLLPRRVHARRVSPAALNEVMAQSSTR